MNEDELISRSIAILVTGFARGDLVRRRIKGLDDYVQEGYVVHVDLEPPRILVDFNLRSGNLTHCDTCELILQRRAGED